MLRHLLGVAVSLLLLTAGRASGEEPSLTVVAVGDIQLGRGVAQTIAKRGVDYPFEQVRGAIQQADLAIFNLECALSKNATPIKKRFSFKGDPAAADGLARAGFDIAVLANNHSLDCGRSALSETLEALRRRYITPVGAGKTAAEAAAPVIVEKKGLRVAVLARTFYYPDGVVYREDAPTVASYDPDRIVEEVRAARKQADIVIVSLHWGVEYARQPQESQRRMARQLIDAGATLVIGHHPHVPQPVEQYKHGLIAYSLGNFVFDPSKEAGKRGLLLKCTLTRKGVAGYTATPTEITDSQPKPSPPQTTPTRSGG